MFYKGSALRPFTTCLSPALSPLIPCLLSTVLSQQRLKSPPQKLFKKRIKTKQNQECHPAVAIKLPQNLNLEIYSGLQKYLYLNFPTFSYLFVKKCL